MQMAMNTMDVSDRTDAENLNLIIKGRHIMPVYQPIVSLRNGQARVPNGN